MHANLANQPIAAIRAHVGQFIWWNGEGGGWGKLTSIGGKILHIELDCGICKQQMTLPFPDLTFLGVATARTITPTWTDLRYGCIIGHIDEHDAVDSRFIPIKERLEDHTHARYWPGRKNGLWRWFFSDGLVAFVPERAWLPGQTDFIHNHLTKRYGIEWYENGYHDLNHLCAHVGAQELADERKDA